MLTWAKRVLVKLEVLDSPLFCKDLRACDRGVLRVKAAPHLNHLLLVLRQIIDVSKQAFTAHEGYKSLSLKGLPGNSSHFFDQEIGTLWEGFNVGIRPLVLSFLHVAKSQDYEADVHLVVAKEHIAGILDFFP